MEKITLYSFAHRFCNEQMKPFTVEHLREAFMKSGGVPPSNHNQWGNLFVMLQHEGVIRHHGFCRAKRALANGRVISIWKSIEYSRKQQLNAEANTRQQTKLL